MSVYYAADRFTTVYAVGDLHGDVGLAIRLFQNVMGLVRRDESWVWNTTDSVCVVLCGDIVDRSRGDGRSGGGENHEQSTLPDDLYLLRLLNEWADLASNHPSRSRVVRLFGNHDLFDYPMYSTVQGNRKLFDIEKRFHNQCGREANQCHRRMSFKQTEGLFHRALWHRSAYLVAQIGPWLFVHAGLTTPALRELKAMHDRGETVHARMKAFKNTMQRIEVLGNLRDLVLTRDMRNGSDVQHTRSLLQQWQTATGSREPAEHLVIGHNVQPRTVCAGDWKHTAFFHPTTTASDGAGRWAYLERGRACSLKGPWINADLDAAGRPVLIRTDTGQSRAWRSQRNSNWRCRPQALCLRRLSDGPDVSVLMDTVDLI